MGIELINSYFPSLSPLQIQQFEALKDLYQEWNTKINVISRKDINNLYERHILHSLSIACFLGLIVPHTQFVDVGTGGGFPAIPLAILYPQAKFHLVDRIAKKLKVASEIAKAVKIDNITIQHGDIAECHQKFDFAISRAVMRLDNLVRLIRKNIAPNCKNQHINGLICLKGGDISEESRDINYPIIEFPISEFFKENFFESKKLVYVPMITK